MTVSSTLFSTDRLTVSVEDVPVIVDPDVGGQGPGAEVEQGQGRVKIEQASNELFSGTLAEMRSLGLTNTKRPARDGGEVGE